MTDQVVPLLPLRDAQPRWDPENTGFWNAEGSAVAKRTLWLTTASLLLSFATWFAWSAIVVRLPLAGFQLNTSERFWLVATPGLVGATLRIPYSFLVQLYGTRRVVTLATASLLIPTVGMGLAVQDPNTPYSVLLALAATAGFGGGNFSAFMASTSLFFPKRLSGTALGLQAGVGNLGVSVVQFLTPLLLGAGALAIGPAQTLIRGAARSPIYLQNAAFFWVIPVLMTTGMAAVWLKDAPVRTQLKEQAVIFRRKHTWVMTSLYVMTFGTFSGLAASTGLLISEIFSPQRFEGAPDPLTYAFIGPLVGSLMRPVGGWISDKCGGAWITLASAITLTLSLGALSLFTTPTALSDFMPFLVLLVVAFLASGIGNGATFRMIPLIFPSQEAAPVLGWTAAIAAYGTFLLPMLFGASISRYGSLNPAIGGLILFYLGNAGLCFWFYARRGAEKPC